MQKGYTAQAEKVLITASFSGMLFMVCPILTTYSVSLWVQAKHI